MTDDMRAKIAERRIARGRELLERYKDARQRASAAARALADANRAIGTAQPPGVHATLIGTDHPQAVRSDSIAQHEVRAVYNALVAWVKEPDEDGRDFGALHTLFAAIDEHQVVRT